MSEAAGRGRREGRRRGGRVPAELAELAADSPVWPSTAASAMKIEVVVNEDGMVWVLHDAPFPDYLEWIEFDSDIGLMTFVTAGGKIQGLGLTVHQPMRDYVAMADEVCMIMLREKEVRDMALVPLTVQGYGLIDGGRTHVQQ